VIGSLYAGHLGRVCEVSVLARREEHARALNDEGLRVSGRSDLTSSVCSAPRRPAAFVATMTTCGPGNAPGSVDATIVP